MIKMHKIEALKVMWWAQMEFRVFEHRRSNRARPPVKDTNSAGALVTASVKCGQTGGHRSQPNGSLESTKLFGIKLECLDTSL